jgi:hypothetical protein
VPRPAEEPVYSVTAVRRGKSDDLAQRQKRYLISMGIRTVCFVLAVVTSGPIRWVFVAAAVVLPYVAVVMANAVGSGSGGAPTAYVPVQTALGSEQREALGESIRRPDDPAAAPPATPPAAPAQAERPAGDGEPVARP